MRMKMNCAVMTSFVLITAAWVAAGPGYEEIVDQSFSLGAGGSVALENVNGDVSIEVWERDEVRVYAVKSASSLELRDGLEVKVDAGMNKVHVDTRYPSTRGSDHEHRFIKVEYTLTVPRTATLDEIELVNGNLTVLP